MKNIRIFILAVLLGLALFAFNAKYPAVAATNSQKPTGITISPAFQQVSVGDVAQQELTFSLTNDKSTIQILKLSTADFNTLGETGGLFFVGANPTELQKKYGLIKWLELPYAELSLNPGQTVKVHAQIQNLPSLSPGGHYGAINIAAETQFGESTNSVNVKPVASTLLFVTKLGGDTHNLSLASVNAHQKLLSLPKYVDLKFQNTGNTHLTPRGIVKIYSPSGKAISQGTINENSNIILPQTFRVYTVPLRKLESSTRPGKYKIEVDFRFDGINQIRAYQSSFLYLPVVWLVVPIAVFVLLAGTWLYWARRRKSTYKR